MTTPPLATSSSSSSGILRALKHIFGWCRDTRQRQDVILNNQHRQNEHMGITDFDEFSLPEPPLVDCPFASLYGADGATMEAAPDDNVASSSAYEEEEEGVENEYDDELSLRHRVSSFPILVS
jgi:hypothetical protein